MNKIIGIAIILASAFFLMDMGLSGSKLFTITGAIKFLCNAAFYVFTAYAGIHLVATGGQKK